MFSLSDDVNLILKMLSNAGYQAYIVGGCVRDFLLHKPPSDFDITTDASPVQVEMVFNTYSVIKTGLQHGTLTVLINKEAYEITTFRTDGVYTDNRRPDSVNFTRSLADDLARRDFTVNALAYNPTDGLQDFFGGENDISNKIIRCVGDPYKRFNEDALRILRALRFSSVLSFEIEENTKAAILDSRNLLSNIAAERIMSEFFKILCGDNCKNVLTEYIEVITVFIPELSVCQELDVKSCCHTHDILNHNIKTVTACENKPYIKLAALLHNIDKLFCFTDNTDVDIARGILNRLKVSNFIKDRALTLIKNYNCKISASRTDIKKQMNKLTSDVFNELVLLIKVDYLIKAPKTDDCDRCDEVLAIANDILSKNECYSLKGLAIKGNDLVALGYTGSKIKEILELVLDKVIIGELENDYNQIINTMFT